MSEGPGCVKEYFGDVWALPFSGILELNFSTKGNSLYFQNMNPSRFFFIYDNRHQHPCQVWGGGAWVEAEMKPPYKCWYCGSQRRGRGAPPTMPLTLYMSESFHDKNYRKNVRLTR